MSDERLEYERQLINEARGKGPLASLKAFTKLSGPGWLQGAITLGGGSLGGSLFLGVVLGFGSMWLQPTAMILGVVMLSAIAYVTLSTGRRPFEAINSEISPVLGWSWLIATMLANMVWCMPQFSLGTGAFTQNLFPGMAGPNGDWIATGILFITATAVIWSYNSGGKAVRFFEMLLKILVGIVVLSFFFVVLRMTFSAEGLPWGEILSGFIPNGGFLGPAEGLKESLAATGQYQGFWEDYVGGKQTSKVITSVATAVGINMTFLMPYSLLRKKWDRDFRGLAVFDLSTGLFIPYLLATSCVVIAAASQFHGVPEPGVLSAAVDDNGNAIVPSEKIVGGVNKLLDMRISKELGADKVKALGADELQKLRDELPEADRRMAAILVERDNQQLAQSLEGLGGRTFAHWVFGSGVLAMAISTIIILMLINGFALCEALGHDINSNTFRIGCILAGVSGALGSKFLWGNADSKALLVVPTSMFGAALLPIAYLTFFLMMNNRNLLKENMPTGANRLKWNVLMGIACVFACYVSVASIWVTGDTTKRIVGFGALAAIAIGSFIIKGTNVSKADTPASEPAPEQ